MDRTWGFVYTRTPQPSPILSPLKAMYKAYVVVQCKRKNTVHSLQTTAVGAETQAILGPHSL